MWSPRGPDPISVVEGVPGMCTNYIHLFRPSRLPKPLKPSSRPFLGTLTPSWGRMSRVLLLPSLELEKQTLRKQTGLTQDHLAFTAPTFLALPIPTNSYSRPMSITPILKVRKTRSRVGMRFAPSACPTPGLCPFRDTISC